jgi:endonuclease/exonuclease/phosphatase (EEP) superfamily protein YafD
MTFNAILLIFLALLVAGTLLTLSDSAHWFVRGWDFPRVQIIVLAWLLMAGVFLTLWLGDSTNRVPLWTSLAIAIGLTCWHGFLIFPYTPIATKQAAATQNDQQRDHRTDVSTVRIVISNVEMENDQYDRWMQTMRDADPDVLILLEPDQKWVDAIQPLVESYPERVIIPQDNWYGMMMLSKLPMLKHEVRYLVQEDIPSIDAEVRLDDNRIIRVIAVHPRPPEPIRGNDSTARDAELTLWGRELAEETRPTIIGGDLNDVAWSSTTRLFLRTSQMLDPRRGRGLFNTFHADHFWMRFPLDHVFVSPDFTISEVRLLPFVGSDHFPIQIDLRHAPEKMNEHEVMTQKAGDEEEAEEKIQRAVDDPQTKGEAIEEADSLRRACLGGGYN